MVFFAFTGLVVLCALAVLHVLVVASKHAGLSPVLIGWGLSSWLIWSGLVQKWGYYFPTLLVLRVGPLCLTGSLITCVHLNLVQTFLGAGLQTAVAILVTLNNLTISVRKTTTHCCRGPGKCKYSFLLLVLGSVTKFRIRTILKSRGILLNDILLILGNSICGWSLGFYLLCNKPWVVNLYWQHLGRIAGHTALGHIELVQLLSGWSPVGRRIHFTLIDLLGDLNHLGWILRKRQAFWSKTLSKAISLAPPDACILLYHALLLFFLIKSPLSLLLLFIRSDLQILVDEALLLISTFKIWIWINIFSNVGGRRWLTMLTSSYLGTRGIIGINLDPEWITAGVRTLLVWIVGTSIVWGVTLSLHLFAFPCHLWWSWSRDCAVLLKLFVSGLLVAW